MDITIDINTYLSIINSHPRDKRIQFFEKDHKYVVLDDLDTSYTSVTTWVHSHFPKFDADAIIESMMRGKNWGPGHKYWGLTPFQIKKSWTENGSSVAAAGTNLHYEIETFMNNKNIAPHYHHKDLLNFYETLRIEKNMGVEWEYFIEFVRDFPSLTPYRTEWVVYDEETKIAGSIDMVYENQDGTLSIYDWKRSKEISANNNFNKYALTECIHHVPDTNFWHYTLQLNIYRMILENQYNKRIKELFLVKLHPDNKSNSYELIAVPILEKEMNDLFEIRKEMFIKKT